LNGSFAPKTSNILKLDTLGLFLQVVFPTQLLIESLLCPQMFLQARHDLHPHVFKKVNIPFKYK
jgi:hypothetical protein